MDNVNNHKEDPKPENNYFNEELKRMIEQIKSIREIEWRTDIEEDKNLKEIKEILSKNSDKGKEGQDASIDSTKTKQQEKERDCNDQLKKWIIKAICYFLTLIIILSVFTKNAKRLFDMAKDCNDVPHDSILYMAGGVLILLFLTIIVIVLARQSKYIIGCKDKAEDE